MDVDEAGSELYLVAPGEFVSTRNRLVAAARARGETGLAREIAALRRPTMSAWAVNLLVHEAAQEVAAVLDLGTGLRSAWSAGEQFGDWQRRRSRVVSAAVRRAADLAERAGHPLREQARHEVAETLEAAVADAQVAQEVRAGRLIHPHSHVGFAAPGGSPSESPAPAVPAPAEAAEDPRLRLRRLEVQAADAQQIAAALESVRTDREQQVGAAQQELEAIEDEEDRLRRELETITQRRLAAQGCLQVARHDHERAAGEADTARHHAEQAKRLADDTRARIENEQAR